MDERYPNGIEEPERGADQFGMSIEAVNDHVAEHEYMTGDERLIYESKDFYVRELAKIFNMLQSWLNYVIGADIYQAGFGYGD